MNPFKMFVRLGYYLTALLILSGLVPGLASGQVPDAQSRCLPTGPPPKDGYEPYLGEVITRGSKVIGGVPAYNWRHGCGPTAAGMVIGYWDGNGFTALIAGEAGSQTSAVNHAIASGNGPNTHYSDYSYPEDSSPGPLEPDLSEPPAGDEHPSHCLADFMKTSWSASSNYYGWSWYSDVDNSFDGFIDYINQSQGTSYGCITYNEAWGSFTWSDLVAEIDNDRPLVFLVDTDGNGGTDHFVTVIGYRDTNGYQEYACLDTWSSNIRWEDFEQMSSGQPWGIYGATYFTIYVAMPQCEVANGSFSLGQESWANESSGPGVGSGIQEVVDHDGRMDVLHLDSRAGNDYDLLQTQRINVRTCDLTDRKLRWEWALPELESALGLAQVYLEFFDNGDDLMGAYFVKRHTGEIGAYDCENFLGVYIDGHPGVAVGCEQETGSSFGWETVNLILDETFFAGLQGAVLDPAEIAEMEIHIESLNLTGAGADVYLDDFALISLIPGTITINAEPDQLMAPWHLAGPEGLDLGGEGDTSLPGMYGGEYTLTWLPVPGWSEPEPNPSVRVLAPGGTVTFQGVYTGQAPFLDVTDQVLGDTGDGRGCAWGDYDNDGDADLYVVNHNQANLLLQNQNGQFVAAEVAILADGGAGNGAAWVDYDNDGLLDLYLSRSNQSNRLFRNEGLGSFSDATTWPVDDGAIGCGVSWVDHDNDGLLDLYLVNNDTENRFFVSYGDFGGGWIWLPSSNPYISDGGNGSCAAWADKDNDGDLDVYITNRLQENKLIQNEGALGFSDQTVGSLGDPGNGAGVAWGDFNNDGWLDLYVANDGQSDLLLRNLGGNFSLVPQIQFDDTGATRGVAFGDFDNDADLDLYLARAGQDDCLLINAGGNEFWQFQVPQTDGDNQGVACADYDNDGDLDVYVTVNGRNRLLRNDTPPANHWLQVEAIGTASSRSAVGARVRVVTGELSQIREVASGSSFMSMNSLRVEFGLGAATMADTVEVRWPAGTVQTFALVPADQIFQITEGSGPVAVQETDDLPVAYKLHECYPNPFNPATTLRYDLPRPGPVDLRIFDLAGRLVRQLKSGDLEPAGTRQVTWRAEDDRGRTVPAGVYFYRLTVGEFSQTNRMVLVK